MTIYFHIGTPKTGTTSLQQFLAANRDRLARQGYHFPTFLGHENHTKLAAYAIESDRVVPVKIDLKLTNPIKINSFREQLRKEFKREIPAEGDYILSNEHCSGHLFDRQELTRLKDLLTSSGQEVRLILYCREPVAAFASRYSTLLKIGHVNPMRVPRPIQLERWYDYLAIANRWTEVFGRNSLTVRLFSRDAMKGGDIRRDFCDVLGLEEAPMTFDYAEDEYANRSLDYLVASFLLQMNKRVPRYQDKAINPGRADLGYLCQRISKREGFLVPKPIVTAMTEGLKEPLARFNQEYMGGKAESPFASYNPKGKEPMRQLTKKEYLDIFAELWEAKVLETRLALQGKADAASQLAPVESAVTA